jgi:transposase-like protein
MPPLSRHLPPLGPKAGPVLQIARQHFDALAVMLAVSFYFEGAFRFRAVGRILSIGCSILGWTRPDPCHTTVRLWAQRIGLHRLRSALVGPRWVMICDHTATFGALKLFVVCGVDIRMLEQRIADKTGNFSLSHRDVRPLAIVPMKHSSGEVLLECFLKCVAKHGNPERMVTDGGSDILKAARLLAEHQQREGQAATKHTYDISHRIARIVQAELEPSAPWQRFEESVKAARSYCKYRARHLSPPNLRHGPDRWMNLGGILKWFSRMAEMVARADAGDQLPHPPRIGLTERVLAAGANTFRKCGSIFKTLKALCWREHCDEQSFVAALEDKCPGMPGRVRAFLDSRNDLNRTYLEETMTGWQQHREIHREVTGMLEFTNAIQKLVKEQGLSKEVVRACEEIHSAANLGGAGERVGLKVMEILAGMAGELHEDERIVAASDVIESLNGVWKMLIGGSATPALGSNALLMAALMGELTEKEVKEALEKVSVADLDTWTKKTFGVTFHQEKRQHHGKTLPEIPKEAIFLF